MARPKTLKTSIGSEEIVAFKNRLRNYKSESKQLEKYNRRIEELWHEYTGLTGIDTTKERGTPNPRIIEIRKLDLSDMIEDLEYEKKRLENDIKYLNDVLSLMGEDDRDVVFKIYCERYRFDRYAKDHFRSVGSIQYQVDNAIKNAIINYKINMHIVK